MPVVSRSRMASGLCRTRCLNIGVGIILRGESGYEPANQQIRCQTHRLKHFCLISMSEKGRLSVLQHIEKLTRAVFWKRFLNPVLESLEPAKLCEHAADRDKMVEILRRE